MSGKYLKEGSLGILGRFGYLGLTMFTLSTIITTSGIWVHKESAGFTI